MSLDLALIGNGSIGALIDADARIVWSCFPLFDGDPAFCSLLRGATPDYDGSFAIELIDTMRTEQEYLPGTPILVTRIFDAHGGAIRITDFAPRFEGDGRVECPKFLVRQIERISGKPSIQLHVRPMQNYGESRTSAESDIRFSTDGPLDAINAETPFGLDRNITIVVGYDEIQRDIALTAEQFRQLTVEWWHEWVSSLTIPSSHREAMVRAAITLKLNAYEETGAIIAAMTTSIPEAPNTGRNWDYRYCWLRDATLTLLAFLNAGYLQEARAWRVWLLRAAAGDPSALQIMYGVAGERRLSELTLDWLPGYEKSSPVRVGNAASEQFQLDVYGEVLDALHQARAHKLEGSKEAWAFQRHLLGYLESAWKEPDEGIWEVRGPRRHFTHSKVMAWVAFDRGVQAVERYGQTGPVERWREIRRAIHREVCERGFDAELGSFTQSYGSKELDASLLIIPLVGFLPAADPRMVGTVTAIEEKLYRDGFVYRYSQADDVENVDGLPPGEGAFLPCTFWLVDNFVLQGRLDEAEALFQRLLDLRSELGLLAEEWDPATRRQLGNFPQAFTHVALVNTAFNLDRETVESPMTQRSPEEPAEAY